MNDIHGANFPFKLILLKGKKCGKKWQDEPGLDQGIYGLQIHQG